MSVVALNVENTPEPQAGVQYIDIVPEGEEQTTVLSNTDQSEVPTYSGLTTVQDESLQAYETIKSDGGHIGYAVDPGQTVQLGDEDIQYIVSQDGRIMSTDVKPQSDASFSLANFLTAAAAITPGTNGALQSDQPGSGTPGGEAQTVYLTSDTQQLAAMPGVQVISVPDLPLNSMCNVGKHDEPLYVNAKQYHRILKRREARAKLEARGRIAKERSKYIYTSRHNHAKKRVRGPGGKFLKQPTSPLVNKENFLI